MATRKELGQLSRQRLHALRWPERTSTRGRLHSAIKSGHIPPAKNYRCVDCGKQAAEYDHYLGYAPEYALVVHPVCIPCHAKRPRAVRSAPRNIAKPRDPHYWTCSGCGRSERASAKRAASKAQCQSCRTVRANCHRCGTEFILEGLRAREWLKNRIHNPLLKDWCGSCWGSQTDYRQKRERRTARESAPHRIPGVVMTDDYFDIGEAEPEEPEPAPAP